MRYKLGKENKKIKVLIFFLFFSFSIVLSDFGEISTLYIYEYSFKNITDFNLPNQIKINVSHLNCENPRVFDENFNYLFFWIEKSNENLTYLWVRVNNTQGKIYLFCSIFDSKYFNKGEKVFLFFDEFNNIDLKKWKLVGNPRLEIIEDTILRISSLNGSCSGIESVEFRLPESAIIRFRSASSYGGNWNGLPQSNLQNGQAYLPFQRVPSNPCDPDVPSNNTLCYARETSALRGGATLWKDLLGDCGGSEKNLQEITWIKKGKRQIIYFNGERRSDRETLSTNTNSSLIFYECGTSTSSYIDFIFVETYKPQDIILEEPVLKQEIKINYSFIVLNTLNLSSFLPVFRDVYLFIGDGNLVWQVLSKLRKFPNQETIFLFFKDERDHSEKVKFFSNHTTIILLSSNFSDITLVYYSYLIGTIENAPVYIGEYSFNDKHLIKTYKDPEEVISEIDNIIRQKGQKIKMLILSNVNSFETSLLAARFAALYNGFPIFVEKNDNIKEKIKETYYWLRSLNLIEEFPEIVIVGNWDEIPFYEVVLNPILGIKTYSDLPYADLNNDNYPDFPIYRLCCNPTEISIQIEAGRLFNNNKKAAIVSNYNSKHLFIGDAYYSKELKQELSKKFEVERYIQHFAKKETENVFSFIKRNSQAFSKIKDLINLNDPKYLLTIVSLFFESLNDYAKFKEYDWQFLEGKLSPKLNNSIYQILENVTFLFSFHLINNSKIILFEDENKSFEIEYPFIPFMFFISHPNIYELFFDNSFILQTNLPTFSSVRNTIQVFHSPKFALQMFSLNNSLAENFREVFIRNLNNPYGIPQRTLYSLVFIGYNSGKNQLEFHNSTLIIENPCNIEEIENITLIFCDANDYIITENYFLPIIFKKVILPKFNTLSNFSFEIKTKSINYYFETNETFPKEFFEIKEVKNINDYSELYFTIYPIKIYPNKSVEVLEYLKINYYTTPKIEIKNIEYNEASKVLKITIFSDIPRNLTLKIEPVNFSQEIFVEGTKEFEIEMEYEGKLRIILKYFDFEIEKIFEIESKLPTKKVLKISDFIEYLAKTYKKEEKLLRGSDEYLYELKTYSFIYRHEIKNLSETFSLITPEYEYTVFQNSTHKFEKIRNAFGTLLIEIFSGTEKVSISGKEKIKEYLSTARETLEKLSKYG